MDLRLNISSLHQHRFSGGVVEGGCLLGSLFKGKYGLHVAVSGSFLPCKALKTAEHDKKYLTEEGKIVTLLVSFNPESFCRVEQRHRVLS